MPKGGLVGYDLIFLTYLASNVFCFSRCAVLDISSSIIRKVEFNARYVSNEYLYLGFFFAFVFALLPPLFRIMRTDQSPSSVDSNASSSLLINSEMVELLNLTSDDLFILFDSLFGTCLKY